MFVANLMCMHYMGRAVAVKSRDGSFERGSVPKPTLPARNTDQDTRHHTMSSPQTHDRLTAEFADGSARVGSTVHTLFDGACDERLRRAQQNILVARGKRGDRERLTESSLIAPMRRA